MWGYWGYGWGAVYDPGYLQADTVVTLESNVYSVPREELLWSSRSETISPSSIELADGVGARNDRARDEEAACLVRFEGVRSPARLIGRSDPVPPGRDSQASHDLA